MRLCGKLYEASRIPSWGVFWAAGYDCYRLKNPPLFWHVYICMGRVKVAVRVHVRGEL